jgi:phage baseplate assembly protein W
MSSFTFKSTGKTPLQKRGEIIPVSREPIGIKTPLEIDNGSGTEILVMYDRLSDVLHDNLKNLILTNWGERLGLYNFGANLQPLLADFNSQDDFDNEAISRIQNAVSKWMPLVNLENFVSNIDTPYSKNSLVKINVRITYSIPSIGVSTRGLEVILSAI